jgi:hypothetical protein
MKTKEAAFKNKEGKVHGTGPCHDLSQLPEDFGASEEGFITDKGEFVTREEAKLEKAKEFSGLPNLGIENRPETPIIQPKDIAYRNALLTNASNLKNPENAKRMKPGALKEAVNRPPPDKGHRVSGRSVAGGSPVASSYAVSNPDVQGTQIHENMHLMFNQVHRKYGEKARQNLAYNIYNSVLKPEHKNVVRKWMKHSIGDEGFARLSVKPHFYEEGLAHLLSYLNRPQQRNIFHGRATGHAVKDPKTNQPMKSKTGEHTLTDEGMGFDRKMKEAFYRVKNATGKIGPNWMSRRFNPGETPLGKMEWEPTEEDLHLAGDMAKAFGDDTPEFKAAAFMASGFQPSSEEIDEALKEHEGDFEAAALMAHKLPVTEENLKLLRSILKINDLDKSEIDIAAIPRIVKPFDEASDEVAKAAQRAFTENSIHKVKLNGKHSAGTALFKDPETDTIWLLKPGSGKLSRALGITEETVSQSRREVGFNRIAKLMGLGMYVPHCALLLIDGQEVAALEFFADGYKTINQLKKDPGAGLETFFDNLNKNGLLFKITALDYLLGSVDRHAGNAMLNKGLEFKLIDAGSSFAGNSYNPAKDQKSFVPYYLRAFSPRNFKVLTPQERLKAMPHSSDSCDEALKYWIETLPTGQIVNEMVKLGINPEPFINRLHAIQDFGGKKSEFLRAFFAGAL